MPTLDMTPPALTFNPPLADPAAGSESELGEVAYRIDLTFQAPSQKWQYTFKTAASYHRLTPLEGGGGSLAGQTRSWYRLERWQGEVSVETQAADTGWTPAADVMGAVALIRNRPGYDEGRFPVTATGWESMRAAETAYDVATGRVNGTTESYLYSSASGSDQTGLVTVLPPTGDRQLVNSVTNYSYTGEASAAAWGSAKGGLSMTARSDGSGTTETSTLVTIENGQTTRTNTSIDKDTHTGTQSLDYNRWADWTSTEDSGRKAYRFRSEDVHKSKGFYDSIASGSNEMTRDVSTGVMAITSGWLEEVRNTKVDTELMRSDVRVDYRITPDWSGGLDASGHKRQWTETTGMTDESKATGTTRWAGGLVSFDRVVADRKVSGNTDARVEAAGNFSEQTANGYDSTVGGQWFERTTGQLYSLDKTEGPFSNTATLTDDRLANTVRLESKWDHFGYTTSTARQDGTVVVRGDAPESSQDTTFSAKHDRSGSTVRGTASSLTWAGVEGQSATTGTLKAHGGVQRSGASKAEWEVVGYNRRSKGSRSTDVVLDNEAYDSDLTVAAGKTWSGTEWRETLGLSTDKDLGEYSWTSETLAADGTVAVRREGYGSADHTWNWTKDDSKVTVLYTDGVPITWEEASREGNGKSDTQDRLYVRTPPTNGMLAVRSTVLNSPTTKATLFARVDAGKLTNGIFESTNTDNGSVENHRLYTEDLSHLGAGKSGSLRDAVDTKSAFTAEVKAQVLRDDTGGWGGVRVLSRSGTDNGRSDAFFERNLTTTVSNTSAPGGPPSWSSKVVDKETREGWQTWDNRLGGGPTAWLVRLNERSELKSALRQDSNADYGSGGVVSTGWTDSKTLSVGRRNNTYRVEGTQWAERSVDEDYATATDRTMFGSTVYGGGNFWVENRSQYKSFSQSKRFSELMTSGTGSVLRYSELTAESRHKDMPAWSGSTTTSGSLTPVDTSWPQYGGNPGAPRSGDDTWVDVVRLFGGAVDIGIGLGMVVYGSPTVVGSFAGFGLAAIGIDEVLTAGSNLLYGRVGDGYSVFQTSMYRLTGSRTAAVGIPAVVGLGFAFSGTAARLVSGGFYLLSYSHGPWAALTRAQALAFDGRRIGVLDLARALDGTTAMSSAIAQGIRNGEILVVFHRDLAALHRAWVASGPEALNPLLVAFADANVIHLSRLSRNLLPEAVHEGAHAVNFLNRARGARQMRLIEEYSAWAAEREYVRALGLSGHDLFATAPQDILYAVFRHYPSSRGWFPQL